MTVSLPLQSLNKYKATISAYELDITDAEMTIQQIAAAAIDRSPDILMHFVGITGPWSFDEMSQEQFEHVMTIDQCFWYA